MANVEIVKTSDILVASQGAKLRRGIKKPNRRVVNWGICRGKDKLTSPAKVAQCVFLAGLLACPNLAAFPFNRREQWHQWPNLLDRKKTRNQTYSSGAAPDLHRLPSCSVVRCAAHIDLTWKPKTENNIE